MSAEERDLHLRLWECRGMTSSSDLPTLLRALPALRLAAGSGPFTATEIPQPIEDLDTDVRTNYWTFSQNGVTGGVHPDEVVDENVHWTWGLLHLDRRMTRGNIRVTRRVGGKWDFLIAVPTFSHALLDMSAEEFIDDWGPRLEHLGDLLYARTAPTLGYVTATGEDEFPASAETVDKRQLVLGWRTWCGPAYVDVYGRDRLLGLPDATGLLDDGGVRHSLAARASTVARGGVSAFAHVWPYVDRAGLKLVWPRRPKPRKSGEVARDEDAQSALIRSDVQKLLGRG